MVVGRDPDDGQFFVATKSALAKTPRVAKSLADIDRLYAHAPSLALCVDRGEVFRAFVVFIIMSGASYTISR